jgi:DNA repair protein RadD
MATGTGKSLVIADLASDAEHRVLILTHSQELVKQNAETYFKYTGAQPGIVCSGLNRSDLRDEVIFGTIQSVINPALRGELIRPTLIIVDEAHRINHKTGEPGMYGRLFERYPAAPRIAMTATPWRMDNGLIYGKEDMCWFDECCYKYSVAEGVRDGWLAPLVGVETETQLDLQDVQVGDDFNNVEVSRRETDTWLRSCAATLLAVASKRKHIAVYTPTIVSAMRASAAIHQVTGWTTDILTGETKPNERLATLSKFKSGETRVLVSVDTLTTGFDFPALDCIACLRPTISSSLWVQILGRGTRTAEDKKNCLVLDFVGNLQRLGGVDMLSTYVRESKGEASEPIEAVPAPPREPRKLLPGLTSLIPLDPQTGTQAVEGATLTVQVHKVSGVVIPTRRGRSLLVQYTCTTPENARIDATRFLDTEKATHETRMFFAARNLAITLPTEPQRVTWQLKGAAAPQFVTVRKSGKYWNVVEEHWEMKL